MKFFITFALIAAIASASPFLKPTVVSDDLAQVEQIIQAIQSPSTDPATAALLEELLLETLGIAQPTPIEDFQPISIAPAIVDPVVAKPPTPVGPAAPPAPPASPAPASNAAPLVQLIVNVNAAGAAGANPVAVESPVIAEAPVVPAPAEIAPTPVQVVESAPEAVIVATPVFPEPIAVETPVVPEPITVVEPVFPEVIVPEPIAVAEPTLPVAPAVTLPETLN